MKKLLTTSALVSIIATSSFAAPNNDALSSIIKKQQRQINALSHQLNILADKVEKGGSTTENWFNKTSLGGYGELHLSQGDDEEVDFHRFVLSVEHGFSDTIKLVTEFEIEHAVAGEGEAGEVEVEQAYIDFKLNKNSSIKAGVFLIPVGIMNEIHEPPTFYGVERNRVENRIIPTSWWEGGASFSQNFTSGVSYDIAVHSGLNIADDSDADSNIEAIRSGRQKTAEAEADSGAATARVKYSRAGLELAATMQYQQDILQGSFDSNIDGLLTEAHIDLNKGHFGLRALYARWDIDSQISSAAGGEGRDEQLGYYVEPSWKWSVAKNADLGVFVRYAYIDERAGNTIATEEEVTNVGINFWPHKNVVLKTDIEFTDLASSDSSATIYNFGIGYQF